MFDGLRRHPFAVEAFFEGSLVLAYAVLPEELAPLVGPGLELDLYEDAAANQKWGFVAIAMVQTRSLRPRGFPSWLGRDFFLTGYRIFAKFVRPGEQTLRGLKILRSDTDRASMVRLGNAFTQYGYKLAEVSYAETDGRLEIRTTTPEREADVHVIADVAHDGELPEGSPFHSIKDARGFAGPLSYTFSYDDDLGKMVVVKGLRQAWDPKPVKVEVRTASFVERFPSARLANAFYVKNIPYSWKRGTLETIA